MLTHLASIVRQGFETTLVVAMLAATICVGVLSLAAEGAASLWTAAISAPSRIDARIDHALNQSLDMLSTVRDRWLR